MEDKVYSNTVEVLASYPSGTIEGKDLYKTPVRCDGRVVELYTTQQYLPGLYSVKPKVRWIPNETGKKKPYLVAVLFERID